MRELEWKLALAGRHAFSLEGGGHETAYVAEAVTTDEEANQGGLFSVVR